MCHARPKGDLKCVKTMQLPADERHRATGANDSGSVFPGRNAPTKTPVRVPINLLHRFGPYFTLPGSKSFLPLPKTYFLQ